MVQIEHFTAPQKCLILNFQDVQIGRVGTKYLAPPSEARKLFILEMNYPFRRIIRLRRMTRLQYEFGTEDELWSKIGLRLIRLSLISHISHILYLGRNADGFLKKLPCPLRGTGFYIFAVHLCININIQTNYSSKFVFGFIRGRIIRLTDNPSRRITRLQYKFGHFVNQIANLFQLQPR